jgi:RHS repeat-associated protein
MVRLNGVVCPSLQKHARVRLALIAPALLIPFVMQLAAFAQSLTGFPTLGSFQNFGPDIVNRSNLNVHVTIPVMQKAGRGIPFNYALNYDSTVWSPVQQTVNGKTTTNWRLSKGWSTPLFGSITYYVFAGLPGSAQCPQTEAWYTDPSGTVHSFGGFNISTNSICGPLQETTYTGDGSGYSLTLKGTDTSGETLPPTFISLYDISGNSIVPSHSITDVNGNSISEATGPSGSTFTDTLGMSALTVSVVSSNPIQYTYTGPTQSETVNVNYSSYTVATNFKCSGVVEYPPTANNLVSSIGLPDGTAYTFHYEATGSGFGTDVTGRVSEIDLPTGGKIQYQYTGGNSGITCTDGSAAGLTRTTLDGVWTYTRTSSTNTAIQDPAGNQTLAQFANGAEIQRTVYQGASTGGTALETVTSCYNFNSSAPCTTATGPPGPGEVPLALTILTLPAGGKSSQVVTYYGLKIPGTLDALNLPSEIDTYDFGASSPTQVKKITYAAFSADIFDHPSCIQITMGSNSNTCGTVTSNTETLTNYSYFSNGNLKQTSAWVQGSNYLNRSYTYFSNGLLETSTDVNSTVTNYTPQNCGPNSTPAYPSIVAVAGLSTTTTWDCNGGVPTQVSDANGQPTKYSYDMFWRQISLTDPLGNVTNTVYSPASSSTPATVETYVNFPSANPTSTVDRFNTLDGLGRLAESQKRTAPNATRFDGSVQYTYGWNTTGPFSKQTIPGGTAITTTQLDALGRTTSVTDGGGGYSSQTYRQNDVLNVVGPITPGENAKQVQNEYDALGRVTSSCAIATTVLGNVACGQNTGSYSGVLTTTAYTSQTVTSTRGSQTRSQTVDGLGRVTSTTTPEGSTTTYTYDSIPSPGTCGGWTSEPGDLMLVVYANGQAVCYVHDALHRVIRSGGATPVCQSFIYDSVLNAVETQPSGSTLSNLAGRLVEAETDNCTAWPPTSSSMITDEWFSYDKDGHMIDIWEMTPHSGMYYHSVATFAGNGAVLALGLANSTPSETSTYGLDGEGRPSTLVTYGQTLVAGSTFNAAGQPTYIDIGRGTDEDAYVYDPNTGRMTNWNFYVGSKNEAGTLTWNPNGTLRTLAITDGFNAGGTQTCHFNPSDASGTGYDDIGRLVGIDCGSGGWGQTFSYDQYDNLTKNVISGRTGVTWAPGYNLANNEYSIGSYDNSGNITSDTFHSYAWDDHNKLLSVDSSACGTNGECVTYDALGRAVEVSNGSAYTEIWYTQLGKTAYMNGSAISYAYWPAPGGATVLQSLSGGCCAYYFQHKDWLGSARILSLIGTNPTVYADRAFAPYGEIYQNFGSTAANALNFTGDAQDILAGMYDTPNREFAGSSQGRWLSPDPTGAGWNLYAYVNSNPLSNVDPSGLACYGLTRLLGFCNGSEFGSPPNGDCSAGGGDGDCNQVYAEVEASPGTTPPSPSLFDQASNGLWSWLSTGMNGGPGSYKPQELALPPGFPQALTSDALFQDTEAPSTGLYCSLIKDNPACQNDAPPPTTTFGEPTMSTGKAPLTPGKLPRPPRIPKSTPSGGCYFWNSELLGWQTPQVNGLVLLSFPPCNNGSGTSFEMSFFRD